MASQTLTKNPNPNSPTDSEEESYDEEEDESSDDEEEEAAAAVTPPPSSLCHPVQTKSTKASHQSSSSDDDDDDDDDDDEEEEAAAAVTPPPSSLRLPKSTMAHKSSSEDVSPAPTLHLPVLNKSTKAAQDEPVVPSKRPAEISVTDSKRLKKNESGAVDPANQASNQIGTPRSKRLWTQEDEFTILKGIPAFTSEKRIDPFTDTKAFYDYIINDLTFIATRVQLREKIRKLRIKYYGHATKSADGKVRAFSSNPHEKLIYHLSNDIWGGVNEIKSNEKPKVVVTKSQNVSYGEGSTSSFIKFNGPGFERIDENFMRRGLGLLSDAKWAELDEKWKNLLMAEMEVFLRRNELIREKAKLTLDILKK